MKGKARRIPDRLQDILEALQNIESDIGDMNKMSFLEDGKTQRAVIEGLIVIGEASNKIIQTDPNLREASPTLWQQLRDAYDMRIILTHEYFRVDAAVVWTTVQENLPELKALVAKALSQYS